MMEFFEGLDPLLKAFWYVALPATVVFAIQSILTFIGADATDGTSADFDGDFDGADAPFQLFSLRNLINFLLGFSWTGIAFYTTINNQALLLGLAVFVGALFVYVFFVIIRQVQKLAEDNSFRIENTINKTADVYLTIPGKKQGKGKIMISVKGSFHELDAMTEHDTIASGAVVKVTRIESGGIPIVEAL
jgi:hypothetical protein